MFTGIVEHIGTIIDIVELDTTASGGGGWSVTIGEAEHVLTDCHIGDSIAVNGTCLTVTEFDKSSFKVGLAPETLRRSNLGDLKIGDKVNLERAVSAVIRFGGHFVQGHVDLTATITSITPESNSLWFKFTLADPSYLRYIIQKGYITIDGTSLTVCEVNDKEAWFTIMLVAHTQAHVTIPTKKIGDKVNIEVDMLGKYVERILEPLIKGDGNGVGGYLEKCVKNYLSDK
ncbi:9402_t:CDS:2 [Ambispora gerdemannii]|uniref:Riboflavin synthase n=1 Tax=Ambispora gerdemannii TaxID=144530 RepID=A0A9N9FMW5_9GLOM|nr:9402_t:CDS:2 [Ambispora gerdemannii]